MINNTRLYIYILINLKKFLKLFFFKTIINNKILKKFNKKKNLFFKKKYRLKTLISRRLFIVLKKRRKFILNRSKKVNRGNFFFKKFFFKTLIKNRKFLKSFFFFTTKIRQKKISKKISKNVFKKTLSKNINYEYTVLNIALRSHICISLSDIYLLFKKNFFFLNGIIVNTTDMVMKDGDCLQLKITKSLYKYILRLKKSLKKKIAIIRFNSWKYFKHKYFKQQQQLKPKKRKIPRHIYMFYLFKLNTPKFLEIDYFSLSTFLLKKKPIFFFSSYYLNKLFSFKLFSLYNFKKIN